MSNAHKELPEDQLHAAKGFAASAKGGTVLKNQAGEQVFTPSMILPNAIAVADCTQAPPTEVAGDVYLLDNSFGTLEIVNIVWQSGNTVRYTFAGSTDLSAYQIGDYFKSVLCTNAVNNGLFAITTVNDASDWIEVTNEAVSSGATDETSSSGNIKATFTEWDGCQQNSWVKFNGSIWEEIVPTQGSSCFLTTPKKFYNFIDDVWSIHNLISSPASYNFKAAISQALTAAPVVEEHVNNTGAVTPARTAVGNYELTFSAAYFTDPEKLNLTWNVQNDHSTYLTIQVDIWIAATNKLAIRVFGDGVEADSALNYLSINAEIYP